MRPIRASSSPPDACRVQGPLSLREGLLLPRRHGETDQGNQLDLYADRPRPPPARKSVAPVVRLDGLCAAVRLAPHRAASHTVRQSDLRHHSSQATQDRRPRASECPPHQGRDGVSMSGGPCLGLRCHSSRRRQRSRLARLTRAAATRNPRGITPRPTETPFAAFTARYRSSTPRVCRRHGGPRLQKTNKPPRQSAQSCKDGVRYTG